MDTIPATPSSTNYVHFKRTSSFYTGVSLGDDSDIKPSRAKSQAGNAEFEMSSPTQPKSQPDRGEYSQTVENCDEVVSESEPIYISSTNFRDKLTASKAKAVSSVPKAKPKTAKSKPGKPKATRSQAKNAAAKSAGPPSSVAEPNPKKRSVGEDVDGFDLPPTPRGPPPSKKKVLSKNSAMPVAAPTPKPSAPGPRRTARKPKKPFFPDSGIEMSHSSDNVKGKALAQPSSDYLPSADTIIVKPDLRFAASQRKEAAMPPCHSSSTDVLAGNTLIAGSDEDKGTNGTSNLQGKNRANIGSSLNTRASQNRTLRTLAQKGKEEELKAIVTTQDATTDRLTSVLSKSSVTLLRESTAQQQLPALILISSDESDIDDADTDNSDADGDFVPESEGFCLPQVEQCTVQSAVMAKDTKNPTNKQDFTPIENGDKVAKPLDSECVMVDKETISGSIDDTLHYTATTTGLVNEELDIPEAYEVRDHQAKKGGLASKDPPAIRFADVDGDREVTSSLPSDQVGANIIQSQGYKRQVTGQPGFAQTAHVGAQLLSSVENRKRPHSLSPCARKKGKLENVTGKTEIPCRASLVPHPENPRTPRRKRPVFINLEDYDQLFDTPIPEEASSTTMVDPFATVAPRGISTPFIDRLMESRSSHTRSFPVGYDIARAEEMIQKADDVFTQPNLDLPTAGLTAPTAKHGRIALQMIRTRHSQILKRVLKSCAANPDKAARWKEVMEKNEVSLSDKLHNITRALTRHLKAEQPALEDVVTDYRLNGHQAIDYLETQHALERAEIERRQNLQLRALTGTVERAGSRVRTLVDRLRNVDVEKALSDDQTSELLARLREKYNLKAAGT